MSEKDINYDLMQPIIKWSRCFQTISIIQHFL